MWGLHETKTAVRSESISFFFSALTKKKKMLLLFFLSNGFSSRHTPPLYPVTAPSALAQTGT